jgi:hypothetical protein
MKRDYYLDLAARGLRMPIGTDLVLKEKANHDERLINGKLLGEVYVEAAKRFNTPLAFPLMDLTIEKEWLVKLLGLKGVSKVKEWQFSRNLLPGELELVKNGTAKRLLLTDRIKANCAAIKHVADTTDLIPVGMSLGPFSMMTTLLKDPISAIYMAGMGMTGSEDEEVKMVETALEVAIAIILSSIEQQLEVGAKAICVCEPAANKVYISPNQLEAGSDIFDRLVISYNKQIRDLIGRYDSDLIFHDCGELTDGMVEKYNLLDPAILSLGSSRHIWDDAKLVSNNTVLFGNLPTKKFYSDRDITKDQVVAMTRDLVDKMKQSGHPFILGSECDVLSVDGSTATILEKVNLMMTS